MKAINFETDITIDINNVEYDIGVETTIPMDFIDPDDAKVIRIELIDNDYPDDDITYNQMQKALDAYTLNNQRTLLDKFNIWCYLVSEDINISDFYY